MKRPWQTVLEWPASCFTCGLGMKEGTCCIPCSLERENEPVPIDPIMAGAFFAYSLGVAEHPCSTGRGKKPDDFSEEITIIVDQDSPTRQNSLVSLEASALI